MSTGHFEVFYNTNMYGLEWIPIGYYMNLKMDLPYNKKVTKECGLSTISSITFDRRLATMSGDIKNRITAMGEFFVDDKIVDTPVLCTDIALIRANGHVWHKSSMKKKTVPRLGTDIDARWGFSRTNGWVFGYKLHMVVSTGPLIVALSAQCTPASLSDNHLYCILTVSLSVRVIKRTSFMSADPGYDDPRLNYPSTEIGAQLVCPV